MKKFTYKDKQYEPLEQFNGRPCPFSYIFENIEFKPNSPEGYSLESFYKVASEAGCGETSVFRCLNDYNIVIPCKNGLHLWETKTKKDMKTFKYKGRTYRGVRSFRGFACECEYITKNSQSDYAKTPKTYSWQGFYDAASEAGCGKNDVFQCLQDGVYVIPTETELKVWIGRV